MSRFMQNEKRWNLHGIIRRTLNPSIGSVIAGFSLTELMVVLVIIGVLVLLALPKLMPIVTKAKTTEAKLMLKLKQVYTLEQSYKLEHDKYSNALGEIGFEPQKLISEGGQARYKIEIVSADDKGFLRQATSARYLMDKTKGV
jgi:type IV pilus assembly protein PilE